MAKDKGITIIQYLVIWQLGMDESSKKETPVEITIMRNVQYSPEAKYTLILKEVERKTGEYDSVNVLGIFKL